MNAKFYYREVEARSGHAWTPKQPRERPACLRKPALQHQRMFRVAGKCVLLTFCGALR